MPGRPGGFQGSFVSGELADTLEARRDLKYYASGLKQGVNCIPLPQGPLTLRPYSRQIGRARRTLTAQSLAGATLAAPSGGTAANAASGTDDRLVTDAHTGSFVALTVDLGAVIAVAAVDLTEFTGPVGGNVSVEWQDAGGTWWSLNGARAVRTKDRSRRFCAAPTVPCSARYWRVLVSDYPSAAAFELNEIAFWREGSAYGSMRLRPFAYSREEAYDLVLMPGHGDVYAAEGGWLTGFRLPHTEDELATSRWRQQLNTGLVFHPQRRTTRIFRENADLEWEVNDAPFFNLPDHDFGDTDYTNGEPAIWRLQYVVWQADGVYTVTVDGEETDGIDQGTADGSAASVAALKDALERLPNVYPGITVEVDGAWNKRLVTFTGEGNEGQVVISATRVLNKPDQAVAWIRVQKGREGGEPIFSDDRGWPRCGIFYQQRLVVGGAPGTQAAFVPSVTGEYFNFSTELSTANGAFVAPLDTEGAETIEEMLNSRALLIFTSAGEHWLTNPVLSKGTPPSVAKASDHGIAPGVPVVSNGDGAIFVAKEGATIIEFRYNEVEQTFTTERLSVLATHLVKDVVDIARKRATSDTDANIILYVQADGQMRIITLLREQEVKGFARVDTDGKVLAVGVNEANAVTLVTERQVAGAPVRFIERWEQGLLLDQALTFTFETPTDVLSGLTDHEDAEIWAIADDEVYGPFTTLNATITLPIAASVVTIGRWRPYLAETLPPAREVAPKIVTESPVGYHTVRVSLMGTTSVAVGANDQEPQDVPLFDFGGAPDIPSLLNPFTGKREIEGFQGEMFDPTMVITQLRPGHITLRSIVGEGDF